MKEVGGGGRCCCPFTFPLTHLQNLSAFFFPFDSITSDRLMNNWLVVSVLRLTDWLCLLMAAPPLCAAMMWLFSLGSWQNGTFFFLPLWKHIYTHTKQKTLLDTKRTQSLSGQLRLSLYPPEGSTLVGQPAWVMLSNQLPFASSPPPAFLYGFCDGMCSRTHAQKICTFVKKGKREIFFLSFWVINFFFCCFFAWWYFSLSFYSFFFRRVWKTEHRDVLTYMSTF